MRLEPITAEDLWLTEAFEGDPEMMVHLGGVRSKEKIAEVHQRRLELMARGEAHMYKVVPDDSDEAMGSIGFWDTEHGGEQVYEMGWFVRREYQGKGVATAAGEALIEVARALNGRRYMHAYPSVTNAGSNAICRKLGFELMGVFDFEFDGHSLRCNNWRLDLQG